jgi:hypothetical protein
MLKKQIGSFKLAEAEADPCQVLALLFNVNLSGGGSGSSSAAQPEHLSS